MVVAVTGHRPNKMYGYDLYDARYIKIKNEMKQFLIEKKCTVGISGMALGIDQLFALAIIELKEEGYDIQLWCAIPCRNHSCKWPKHAQELYQKILERADKVVYVSEENYAPYLMQKRNEWMVDRIDELLAIYNGTPGGTKNCIDYAKKLGKPITIICP
jgi:uncharacterized phage-like protein YoqJ